jgi:CRISPR-associated protein Cmr4
MHALSPIHCGTGQAAGGVDLPIAREKSTEIPLVPGSSLKGVLRASSSGQLTEAVFGPDTDNASLHAGSVQFGDCSLAFLPVRSVLGTVAWVTSPYLLQRLRRDARLAGVALGAAPRAPASASRVALTSDVLKDGRARVFFEDLDFFGEKDAALVHTAERVAAALFDDPSECSFFADRVCQVHDDVMKLLLRTGMEFIARNRVDAETGTVARGGLWTEEALPVETVLSGLLVATPVRHTGVDASQLLEHVVGLLRHPIQVGGGATVGRGLCQVRTVQA